MINFSAPDLTQHPPRSPRVRLGGFVHLPRLLDKARAFVAGKHGAYTYPCPMDERLFAFVGVSADAFLDAVRSGKSDTQMLAWLRENMSIPRAPHEILAWSEWLQDMAPGDPRRHGNFATEIERMAPGREDIVTTFDRLELDDFTSFGGQG
ncbi:DUF5069 domain-containing protein [Synoicihabitans lomoniglobus]|uniref:DUF5069 domain-containing protein n=1 Tax=Synoicihabitans lomoniglobus TaxID=2909285 RepID=A0AAF0I524_9BACT|nr:DUF5069 domain-containing protein [Opitutaceae bacterium LMO-M01]WED67079.1 DUF5069 domain-containing protein [Opitutaceae bacterium LMO-M01]